MTKHSLETLLKPPKIPQKTPMKPLKNSNYEKSKIICKKTSKSPLKI
jgi:hypothetical protein